MKNFSVENCVLILDCSQKSIKTFVNGIRKYIQKKQSIDNNDNIEIISLDHNYNNKFDNFQLTNDQNLLFEKLKALKNFGKDKNRKNYNKNNNNNDNYLKIGEKEEEEEEEKINTDIYVIKGTQKSLSLLSEQIRNISGQINRILFISDNPTLEISNQLKELVSQMKGLEIFFDICLYVEKGGKYSREDFLYITNSTKGEFGIFYNKNALYRGLEGFASKKITEEDAIEILTPKQRKEGNISQLLDIALPLTVAPKKSEDITIEETKEEIYLNSTCKICFKKKSPLNNNLFKKTGRFCPHCNTPMHLYCAGSWALKSEEHPQIFRCPYCYTLLKINTNIINGLQIQKKINAPLVKMIRYNQEKNEKNFKNSLENDLTICLYCFEKIEIENLESEKIFQCSACRAPYHVNCLESMYKKNKSCKNCNGIIK